MSGKEELSIDAAAMTDPVEHDNSNDCDDNGGDDHDHKAKTETEAKTEPENDVEIRDPRERIPILEQDISERLDEAGDSMSDRSIKSASYGTQKRRSSTFSALSASTKWSIELGVIPACETPSASIRAEQKVYTKNLATTMSTLTQRRSRYESSHYHPASGVGGVGSFLSRPHSSSGESSYGPSVDGELFGSNIATALSQTRILGKIIVLVNLQLLDISRDTHNQNHGSDSGERKATIVAVNKFGFPPGMGRIEEERCGPYLYVACMIKSVQEGGTGKGSSASKRLLALSEDDSDPNSYCTVERCDTGTHQTVRSDWGLKIIEDTVAIRAAMAAARGHHQDDSDTASASPQSPQARRDLSFRCWNKLKRLTASNLIPRVGRFRVATKVLLTQLVRGNRPFSLKVRITGINFMVLCSTLFFFTQVIYLSLAPPEWDSIFVRFETALWCILVVELILEYLIRPADYHKLIRSDKAYRPSTARYINSIYLAGEIFALILYIPEMLCFYDFTSDICVANPWLLKFLLTDAAVTAVIGPTLMHSLYGQLVLGLLTFRLFGVIRHWQRMLIQEIFNPTQRQGIEKWFIRREIFLRRQRRRKVMKRKQDSSMQDDETDDSDFEDTDVYDPSDSQENRRLKSAANIGTALIVVHCQRALILMVLSAVFLPLFVTVSHINPQAENLTKLLQSENLVSTTGFRDCVYLEHAISSWLNMAVVHQLNYKQYEPQIMYARVLPVRCPFQNQSGVITSCTGKQSRFQELYPQICDLWENTANPPDGGSMDQVVRDIDWKAFRKVRNFDFDIRVNTMVLNTQPASPSAYQFEALNDFKVVVLFNQNPTMKLALQERCLMLTCIFFLGLFFLVQIYIDINELALLPIKRMLRIVVHYAENPLSSDIDDNTNKVVAKDTATASDGDSETDQLLSAITKISDLLRKCWGVAGAGIISSNLGREKDGQVAVFNPTVPGKQVYALFGFVSFCGYSELLKALDRDIIYLINDIAKVVHDETYRWGFGDHGQCNKNLGNAFLMIWRIGDFNEVQKKNRAAIEKMFQDKMYKTSKNRANLRRRAVSTLRNTTTTRTTAIRTNSSLMSGSSGTREFQLESLPGIQEFADRALLGMLKSFAGIHRDKSLQVWRSDFRLRSTGGSVATAPSSYTVDIIYGMDAGWAVEGAVGSEYKIDATYLSPHVNMASRMMSASKQYGATILLSKAVEKLLSKPCKSKLRHLDTVYVKGSAVKQSIYTYDARYSGVDFFLLERSPDQADLESEDYTPAIWDNDQDLLAMRRHVSEEFVEIYHNGVRHYLEGSWAEAYQCFEKADAIMIRTVLEEGYIEIADDEMLETLEDRILDKTDLGDDVVKLRHEFGDGACRTVMAYMKARNLTAPNDWDGVRHLFSK